LTAARDPSKLTLVAGDQTMPSEDLNALLAKVQQDPELRAKLEAASDLDQAEAIVKEAGFNVSKAEWLAYQGQEVQELQDEALENVAGGVLGKGGNDPSIAGKGINFQMEEGSFNCGGGGGGK
jgi:predicted ribosomally synthesized peptide with nif11-like leader